MPTYLIETPHTEEECRVASDQWVELDHPRRQEIFEKEYFGCEFGLHSAWVVADFENEDEVWALIPPAVRSKARVVPVVKYSWDEMLAAHRA